MKYVVDVLEGEAMPVSKRTFSRTLTARVSSLTPVVGLDDGVQAEVGSIRVALSRADDHETAVTRQAAKIP